MEIREGIFVIKSEWTREEISDLEITMGLDVEKIIEEVLTEELKKEMRKETRKIPTLTGRIAKIKIK
jgi:hypothetical protein